MKKLTKKLSYIINFFYFFLFIFIFKANVLAQNNNLGTIDVGFRTEGFNLPSVLSFFVRAFFTIAALVALFYLLWGAFSWITSGGEKEKVSKAQEKIQAAVIGIVLIVAVIAIAVTLEQVIFRQAICFGLTCGIKIPGLIEPSQ